MRATLVTTRNEWRGACGDTAKSFNHIGRAFDLRHVRLGADDDEIVVHDIAAVHTPTLIDELVLGWPVVNQHDIGIATAGSVKRLTSAQSHHLDLDAGLCLEARQHETEQARL